MLHDLHVDEPPKPDDEAAIKAKADEDAVKADEDAKAAQEQAIKDADERTRVADERSQRVMDAYTQLAATQATPTPASEPAATLPDPVEDPTAFMEAKIKEGVEAGLQQHVGPLAQQYRQDRVLTLGTTIEQNKSRIRADTNKFPGYDKYEDEINEFMKNYQPDELARPGAIEECYYRVIGRKNAEELAATNARSSGPETGGRATGVSDNVPTDTNTQLTALEVKAAARAGMSEKDFRSMQGLGKVTVDEYLQMKEAAK